MRGEMWGSHEKADSEPYGRDPCHDAGGSERGSDGSERRGTRRRDSTVRIRRCHARLPAGDYVIRAASDGLDVWAITSEDGHHSALVTTIAAPSSRVQAPELVFDRFANQYFLSRIVVEGSDLLEIPLTPARMEHEVVKLALKN